MIIQNGHIRLVIGKEGGGLDPETGYPVKPDLIYGEDIPCQMIPNRYDRFGRSNGESFTVAEYTVLVEEGRIGDAEELELFDIRGKSIGKFGIISLEHLRAVGQDKIMI